MNDAYIERVIRNGPDRRQTYPVSGQWTIRDGR